MEPQARASLLLALLFALAVSSVGLKAAVGPINDGKTDLRPRQLETQLERTLRAQGFSVSERPRPMQSTILFAKRGDCLLSVRDARGGTAVETVFARNAASIGPVRYLYRGTASASVPSFRIRLGRFEAETLHRLGVDRPVPVPVALATSAACESETFGLEDFRIGA